MNSSQVSGGERSHSRSGINLSFSTDLIRPRGDDQKITSRPITPQLVLDRTNPDVHSDQHSRSHSHSPVFSIPVSPPTCPLREPDPGYGPQAPPSEASSPVDAEDYHDHKGRKHVCHRCGKRFNRPSSLTIHYHTHTGERREHPSLSLLPFP